MKAHRAVWGAFGILSTAASAAALVFACASHNDTPVIPAADAATPRATSTASSVPTAPSTASSGTVDAGDPCAYHAWRGGSPNNVVCPGTASCGCTGPAICCMTKLDANSGSCAALGSCRNIAIQCDGPEDCDGGVCCLENRSGGGTSCKSQGSCQVPAEWLCRSDTDCIASPNGPRCSPIDLGVQGVDDKGLDGLLGVCGN
jgi:hypothetical protein